MADKEVPLWYIFIYRLYQCTERKTTANPSDEVSRSQPQQKRNKDENRLARQKRLVFTSTESSLDLKFVTCGLDVENPVWNSVQIPFSATAGKGKA